MTLRKFALILVASQVLATAAGAVEYKSHPHPRAADRALSAKVEPHYGADDRAAFPSRAPAANLSDPPSNANGS
jgi:hypothetical protein